MLRPILMSLKLGLKLAWAKGHRGERGEWVGAYYSPWNERGIQGVKVGITKQRAEQLGQRCRRLLSVGEQVPRIEVRQLAGLASWMSGLMPQLNAFTRMLWAAIHSGQEATIARKQVCTPLSWFAALSDSAFGPLERRCRRKSKYSLLITFDGSLTGGGATLQASGLMKSYAKCK